MTDIMYEIPSNDRIEKCIITKAVVTDKEKPEVILSEEKASA